MTVVPLLVGGAMPTSAVLPASPPLAQTGTTASPREHETPAATQEPEPAATPLASPSDAATAAVPSLEPTQPAPADDSCQLTETYVVVSGDTFSGIAGRYGLTVGALLAANPQVDDANRIGIGDRISVPVVSDLDPPGGTQIRVADINERGDIVGASDVATNVYHAARWRDGVATDLGTLGGLLSQATDINDRGQIVGASTATSDPAAPWRAVVWQDGDATDLGTLGGPTSMAVAINGRGQVVGTSSLANGTGRGFIWADGVMRDLGTLGGVIATVPTAINDRGQVVGAAYTADGEQHAFLWQAGRMRDLGTLGGTWSFAHDVNERGQVVGVSSLEGEFEGPQHAFLWQNGVMTDLGALDDENSGAVAINERGQIVGWGSPRDGTPRRPLLWADGRITDLRIDGEREGMPVGLNDRGQVVGTCLMRFSHAIVLQLKPALGVVLEAPAADAPVAQNDASTGCAATATRGNGLRLTFSWGTRLFQRVGQYRLVAQHTGSTFPWISAELTDRTYAVVSCSFVADTNLSDWHWQVTAFNTAGDAVAVSESRPFQFLPCRLADDSSCSAPG